MSERKLLATTFLLHALLGVCQDSGYIGFGLGASVPVSDFGSTSQTNERAGYANTGGVFDLSFALKIKGNLGVAAMLRGTANFVDAQAIADQFVAASGTSVKVEAGSWSTGDLVVGPYGSFPISEKTRFEAKALFGFAQASSPRLKFSRLDGGMLLAEQQEGDASTFTYVIAVGFKFDVGARTCLLAGLDYQGLEAQFTDVRIDSGDGSTTRTSFKQPFSMINVGVGIARRL